MLQHWYSQVSKFKTFQWHYNKFSNGKFLLCCSCSQECRCNHSYQNQGKIFMFISDDSGINERFAVKIKSDSFETIQKTKFRISNFFIFFISSWHYTNVTDLWISVCMRKRPVLWLMITRMSDWLLSRLSGCSVIQSLKG